MHQPHDGVAGVVKEHGDKHPDEFREIRSVLRREPHQAESQREERRCVAQVGDAPAQFGAGVVGDLPKNRIVDRIPYRVDTCLLYTSDAAADLHCVDLGGRRFIKKKITNTKTKQNNYLTNILNT